MSGWGAWEDCALTDDIAHRGVYRILANNRYTVFLHRVKGIDGWPGLIHLSIKRNDREPIHDWRELQRIKNEIVGPENEGVELYPAESRLVDTANQFHLWVLMEEGQRFPIGFPARLVARETIGKAKQRPFEETPPDALSGEDMRAIARELGVEP